MRWLTGDPSGRAEAGEKGVLCLERGAAQCVGGRRIEVGVVRRLGVEVAPPQSRVVDAVTER